jgi:hypothetical protein
MTTNITVEHRAVFEALTSGDYDNFALCSCFLDGEPTVAIVTVNRNGEIYTITPLFVAVMPDMLLTDHDGNACEPQPTGRVP